MNQTIWVRNSCLATTIIGTDRFGAIQGWNQLLAGVHRNLLATRPDAHPLVCLSTWDAEQRNQSCRKKSIKCKHFYTQAENKKTLKGGESFDWNLLTNWVSALIFQARPISIVQWRLFPLEDSSKLMGVTEEFSPRHTCCITKECQCRKRILQIVKTRIY